MTTKKTHQKGAWNPRAGDGIWDLNSKWCEILGVNTRGLYALVDNDPNTAASDIVGFHVRYPNGRERKEFPISEMRCRESLVDFYTRPTGFGRIPWPLFILIQVGLLCLLIAGIMTWKDYGWMMAPWWFIVNAILLVWGWLNYSHKVA